MTDIKLILNIQLFAEVSAEESGIQDSESGKNEAGKSDATDKSVESENNPQVESDVLDDGAGYDEEKEIIREDTEDETEDAEEGDFIDESEERLRNRISAWLDESRQVKELYPDFDLRQELRSSKLFSQLVLSGAPVKAAYEVVHKDEILSGAMAYTADKVREQVVKNIEAKGRRPLENGISSESAVMTAVDVNALTSKDILKILKQVENGASIKF